MRGRERERGRGEEDECQCAFISTNTCSGIFFFEWKMYIEYNSTQIIKKHTKMPRLLSMCMNTEMRYKEIENEMTKCFVCVCVYKFVFCSFTAVVTIHSTISEPFVFFYSSFSFIFVVFWLHKQADSNSMSLRIGHRASISHSNHSNECNFLNQ